MPSAAARDIDGRNVAQLFTAKQGQYLASIYYYTKIHNAEVNRMDLPRPERHAAADTALLLAMDPPHVLARSWLLSQDGEVPLLPVGASRSRPIRGGSGCIGVSIGAGGYGNAC
jgi:hypothetical protein